MAQTQAHFSFAAMLGAVYGLAGAFLLEVPPETCVLGSVLVVIAGLLPNVDASGGSSSRELAGLLAAISPLIAFELLPKLRDGGVVRIVLVVICCYILTRILVIRFLQKFTSHRGMLHSIPASVVTFELTYLLLWDLKLFDRTYVATGAFVGFFSHLLLDGYGNLDLMGQAMGKAAKKQPALKFFGNSMLGNFAWYGTAAVLGWFVLRDMYPALRIYAGVKY